MSGNRRCFAAWHEEQIVSYCWISQQREHVGEMERVIHLQAGEAYVWDCATLPHFRRRGLYTALLGFINRALAAEGLRRIWIGANLENEPSRRAFDTVGFRRVATMTHVRLLALSLYLTTADPGVPAAWVAAARRLFGLHGPLSWGPLCLDWRWPGGPSPALHR
jgi:RimJ/RimL family protein N-acetyltransferase